MYVRLCVSNGDSRGKVLRECVKMAEAGPKKMFCENVIPYVE